MKIINQTDMRYGEIDPDLLGATNEPQYLQAIAKGTNCYINSKRKISKRTGFIIDESSNLLVSGIEDGVKEVTYTTNNNIRITAILYVNNNVSPTGKFLILYVKNWSSNEEREFTLYGPILETVEAFSMDASDKFIVIANENHQTVEVTVDTENIALSNAKAINFSVIPSIDDGSINYSEFEFEVSGDPLGSIITISNLPGGQGLGSSYVGGMVISRNGTTVDQPLATGIITGVGAGNPQILTVIVTSPFSDKAIKSGGAAWSVRAPIWSATKGYARLASFHGGRLWLTGTKEYPTIICGSTEGLYNDFNVRDGNPTDAIVFLMKDSKGGAITHMFGGINLNIWTNQTQYIAWSGLDVGLTPKNFAPKPVSDYSISKSRPIRYKDKIYFSTSDGKALIELDETYQNVKAIDISFSAKHLINNPIQAEISILDSENEQLAFFVNADKSVFCYSKSAALGVTAFTPMSYVFPENYILLALISVSNTMYQVIHNIVTRKTLFLKSRNDLFLDTTKLVTFTGGIAPTLDTYKDGEVLDIIQIVNGTTFWHGEATVVNNELVKDLQDGDYFTGFIYDVNIKSVNNIANPQNVFYKTKKYKNAIEFYKSYDLKINSKSSALPNLAEVQQEGVVLKSGVKILGSAKGAQSFQQITITQHAPYPCNIQGIGYIAEADLRL